MAVALARHQALCPHIDNLLSELTSGENTSHLVAPEKSATELPDAEVVITQSD